MKKPMLSSVFGVSIRTGDAAAVGCEKCYPGFGCKYTGNAPLRKMLPPKPNNKYILYISHDSSVPHNAVVIDYGSKAIDYYIAICDALSNTYTLR